MTVDLSNFQNFAAARAYALETSRMYTPCEVRVVQNGSIVLIAENGTVTYEDAPAS